MGVDYTPSFLSRGAESMLCSHAFLALFCPCFSSLRPCCSEIPARDGARWELYLQAGKGAWVGRAGLGQVLTDLAFASAPWGTVRVLSWGAQGACHIPTSATGSPSFSPACHQQTSPGRRTARVAELACIWQELSLLFALEEIKTNGALAIATMPAWCM